MSWAVGYDDNRKRDIGYGVPSICEHPGCDAQIDRGMGYACGGCHYEGEGCCALYFCGSHLHYPRWLGEMVCERCADGEPPFEPKPDTEEWINHKATDPSWEQWRKEQAEKED